MFGAERREKWFGGGGRENVKGGNKRKERVGEKVWRGKQRKGVGCRGPHWGIEVTSEWR